MYLVLQGCHVGPVGLLHVFLRSLSALANTFASVSSFAATGYCTCECRGWHATAPLALGLYSRQLAKARCTDGKEITRVHDYRDLISCRAAPFTRAREKGIHARRDQHLSMDATPCAWHQSQQGNINITPQTGTSPMHV